VQVLGIVACSLFLVLGSYSCGDEKSVSSPAEGTISIDGGPLFPFSAVQLTITVGGTTTSIVGVNTIAQSDGTRKVSTFTLVVPNNTLNTWVVLDNNTKFVETTTNNVGGTVSTEFSSKTITNASVYLSSLSPTAVAGTFSATFNDGVTKKRQLNFINFNSNFQ